MVLAQSVIFRILALGPPGGENRKIFGCKSTVCPKLLDYYFPLFSLEQFLWTYSGICLGSGRHPFWPPHAFGSPTRPHLVEKQKLIVHRYCHGMYFGQGNPAGADQPDLSTAIFQKLEITTLKGSTQALEQKKRKVIVKVKMNHLITYSHICNMTYCNMTQA